MVEAGTLCCMRYGEIDSYSAAVVVGCASQWLIADFADYSLLQ